MQENPVFHKAQDFQFQPSEYDTVRRTDRKHPLFYALIDNDLQLLELNELVGGLTLFADKTVYPAGWFLHFTLSFKHIRDPHI